MAFLQPQNIPSRNDLPDRVQVVAKLLRDLLPDDVTVWLERTGDGDTAALRREFDPAGTAASGGDFEPYLVLLDPEAGIAVLEAPTVTRTRRHLLRNRRLEAEPLRQAIESARHGVATRPECRTSARPPGRARAGSPRGAPRGLAL